MRRGFLFVSALALAAAACAPASPTSPPVIPMETVMATLGPDTFFGVIEYPYLHADAGNFQLQAGQTTTFTWTDPPADADRYDFIVHPLDGTLPIVIGMDSDASDGVSLQWEAVPNISGQLVGMAYFPDGQVLQSAPSGTIYTGSLP